MKPSFEKNSVRYTLKIKARMRQLIDDLRKDVRKVTEPDAQALFETSAKVLTILVKAFDDCDRKGDAR